MLRLHKGPSVPLVWPHLLSVKFVESLAADNIDIVRHLVFLPTTTCSTFEIAPGVEDQSRLNRTPGDVCAPHLLIYNPLATSNKVLLDLKINL